MTFCHHPLVLTSTLVLSVHGEYDGNGVSYLLGMRVATMAAMARITAVMPKDSQ